MNSHELAANIIDAMLIRLAQVHLIPQGRGIRDPTTERDCGTFHQ